MDRHPSARGSRTKSHAGAVRLLALGDELLAGEASKALANLGGVQARRGCVRVLGSDAPRLAKVRRRFLTPWRSCATMRPARRWRRWFSIRARTHRSAGRPRRASTTSVGRAGLTDASPYGRHFADLFSLPSSASGAPSLWGPCRTRQPSRLSGISPGGTRRCVPAGGGSATRQPMPSRSWRDEITGATVAFGRRSRTSESQ